MFESLCRKYNSLLHKTTTVGLRQAGSLTGRIFNKKKKSCESVRKSQGDQKHRFGAAQKAP